MKYKVIMNMDEISKYIPLLVYLGSAIVFLFGFFQWLDQRKRELEERNFNAFHKMICLASGATEEGKSVMLAQQIAAVYQLQRYKEYKYATVPILENLRENFSDRGDEDALIKAINKTIKALS